MEAGLVVGDELLVGRVEAVAHGTVDHSQESVHGGEDWSSSGGQEELSVLWGIKAGQLGLLQLLQT